MLKESYSGFLKDISKEIPQERVYVDELRRFAWGTDAGCYRMVPQIVVRAKDEKEVSMLLRTASSHKLPVTFRAAGTSLSGQSVSDSILIVAGKNWEEYRLSEDGSEITMQPGLTGKRIKEILSPLGLKFAPDPASINSAMIGGIVMNNASGMSCGTHANSDKEMLSCRLVFADGTVLDTASEESRSAFKAKHPEIIKGIEKLRDEIAADKELYERIKYKYEIKNVTGLNIAPLVRFTDPFDILAHLMVGSEGTLAFLSEVTMKTRNISKFTASAMIYFPTITDAAKAVVAMKKEKIDAAELLDPRSLASVGDPTPGRPTAVLTQTTADSEKELEDNIKGIQKALEPFETVTPVHFTDKPEEYAKFWAIRSGIFPSVGGMRKTGTTCIIEDVAFHIQDLPQATADLSDLLDTHGYDDSCIYGHALEGNFHFIINQSFDTEEEVSRYEKMIKDVAEMVVGKYDGSLKAEHGTGRNMAPFVKYEWGEKAFGIMKRIKALFDPENILNPGVIFNDDPDCFIKHLKELPILEPAEGASEETKEAYSKLNKCIECGFCEINCLSCGFTLSSRTRIALQREITRRRKAGDDSYRELERSYKYLGEETCAADGLCSTSCPMGINVGDMTHELRRQNTPATSLVYKAWNGAANHFPVVKDGIRGVLALAETGRTVIGEKAMSSVCSSLHKGLNIPLWTPSFPQPFKLNEKKVKTRESDLKVVYIPSCLNQMMGKTKGTPADKPLVEETVELLGKAGYQVIFPKDREKLCCGTLWESKGMPDIALRKVREMEEALWEASEHGKYPVLCDQSPCLHNMRKHISSMHLYEPAEFIYKFLADKLVWHKSAEPVAIHQTCTMRLMGLGDTLYKLASLCSDKVLVPEGIGCCGFAGDKGMTNPEVNKWALRKLRSQLEKAEIKVGYSNSRTCEIGLQTNSGIPYISIVYLVNKCTEAI